MTSMEAQADKRGFYQKYHVSQSLNYTDSPVREKEPIQ